MTSIKSLTPKEKDGKLFFENTTTQNISKSNNNANIEDPLELPNRTETFSLMKPHDHTKFSDDHNSISSMIAPNKTSSSSLSLNNHNTVRKSQIGHSQSGILRLRNAGDGSHTLVEHETRVNPPQGKVLDKLNSRHNLKNLTLPILRLNVNPLTNHVEYNSTVKTDDSVKYDDITDLQEHNNTTSQTDRFIIKKQDSTYVIHECDDYTEIYDSLPSGLSWGEKRSKAGDWSENWLQQKLSIADDGTKEESIFGEKFGQDLENHQNWSEAWTKYGDITKVKRIVFKYNENHSEILEEWNEKQYHDTLKKLVKIDKYGEDRTSGQTRFWKSNFHQFENPDKNHEIFTKEFFQEDQLGVQKGTILHKEGDLITYKKNWYKDISEGGENWEQDFFCNNSGNKWGKKSGINDKGHNWGENWFRTNSGDYETDKWTIENPSENSEDKISYGEKRGYSSQNDQEYTEIWSHFRNDELETRTDSRKWSKPSENRHWEETLETHNSFKKPHSNSTSPHLHQKKEILKKSATNLEETVNSEEQTITDYSTINSREIRQVKKGNKHGYHYKSDQEWNDEWSEQWEYEDFDKSSRELIKSKPPVLVLNIKSYDKWWKENKSNCWGEKKFDNFTTGEIKEEKWYFNPSGWQVDKWGKNQDGLWTGEKHGANQDGTSWKEQWNEDNISGEKMIEKSWKQIKDDIIHQWGETSNSNCFSFTKSKWAETNNSKDQSAHLWSEKVKDDGFGNIMNEKEGSTWRAHGTLSSWYYDSFGESLGKKEKWAFKKGYEEKGSQWLEKWNELPSSKFAHKSGKNSEGDEWVESWEESIEGDKVVRKWAEKQGKNNRGDEWIESWIEENEKTKSAFKKGSNLQGEMWEEKWGEAVSPTGSGEKWTSKWAKDVQGNYHGNSFGDRWDSEHNSGHHWGEEWTNEDIRKWSYDSHIKPW